EGVLHAQADEQKQQSKHESPVADGYQRARDGTCAHGQLPWSLVRVGRPANLPEEGDRGKGETGWEGSCCAEETCQRRVQKSTKVLVRAIDAWRGPAAGRNVEEVSYRAEFAGCGPGSPSS